MNGQGVILLIKSNQVRGHSRNGIFIKPYVRGALMYAAGKHRGQYRKDGKTPYISHPVAVARILAGGGVSDDEMVASALLHDTIEDTGTTYDELVNLFGRRVADIVQEVTNDPALDKQAQKLAQINKPWSADAGALKLADKTANLRDIIDSPPIGMSDQKRLEYVQHAKNVVDAMNSPDPRLLNVFMDQYRACLQVLKRPHR